MNKHHSSTLGSGGWFLVVIISILFSFSTASLCFWIKFDTQEVAYGIYNLQNEMQAAKIHISKLEIERDSLLSPHVLVRTAERLGMNRADQGQIRRIEIHKK